MSRLISAIVLGALLVAGLALSCAPASYVAMPALNAVAPQPAPLSMPEIRLPSKEANTEAYSRLVDNPFLAVRDNPLSTFSIDVDTASYSNMRRFLSEGRLPPPDAVRIEEMINYFPYAYEPPRDGSAFAAHLEAAPAPWKPEHLLVRIGIKGREIARAQRPASNLVFLLDVSGSMQAPDKLPLVKQAMKLLVEQLDERDRVAIAVYAGASGLALPSTSGADARAIVSALDRLEAGGATHGAEGIELAYKVAAANFIPGGANRVILATDGDFNVGVTSQGELVRLIEAKAKSGVFLTVLGFGTGNLKDSTMESLADKGNGNYAYIDTLGEARKVLVEEVTGTLVTIAKDVKIQVELNPLRVAAYRLIGYENRLLRAEDFNDDRKDAGEIGAGHTVTALYELAPAGQRVDLPGVDPLKYQRPGAPTGAAQSGELLNVKIRYKDPDGQTSRLLQLPFQAAAARATLETAGSDFRFAAAVAQLGMLLRDSPYRANASYESTEALAAANLGEDRQGHRREFLELVRRTASLTTTD